MNTPSMQGSRPRGFVVDVLRALTWRAVLVTQALALVFTLMHWFEHWTQPTPPPLLADLLRQAIAALLVVLAAFAGDEAVRRGARVWCAFLAAVVGASAANVLAQSVMAYEGGLSGSELGFSGALDDFLILGALWAPPLMVFLNRKAAQRLLMRLRAGELGRVEAERRLTASRLAAAEAQIDSSALLSQLAEVRDLYDAGRPEAEPRFEALITGLRETLARAAAVQTRDAHS